MPVEVTNNTEAFKERHRNALEAVMPEVAEDFLEFQRVRYIREGDGEWADLAPRTRRERADQGFSPEHPILRRLEIVYGALTRGNDGNVFEVNGTSVVVGIGGGGMHPGYGEKYPPKHTIGEIALIHQLGIGVPVRRIMVEPDEATRTQMTAKIQDRLGAEAID